MRSKDFDSCGKPGDVRMVRQRRRVSIVLLIILIGVTTLTFSSLPPKVSAFSRAGSLPTIPGEGVIRTGVVDSAGGYAYFGTSRGVVVKLRLSDFAIVGNLTLLYGAAFLSSVIDTANGFAYFGGGGYIFKISLQDFTVVDSIYLCVFDITLICGSYSPRLPTAVIDAGAGYAYFGLDRPEVDRINLSNFTFAGSLTLNASQYNWISSAVIDPAGGFAYFSSAVNGNPYQGLIVKVSLSSFTEDGSLSLNLSDGLIQSSVIDPVRDFAYFAANSIVKIRLSDFTRNGSLTLNSNESLGSSSAIDSAAGFAYFGASYTSSYCCRIVVKVSLSSFTEVGNLALFPDAGTVSAVIDATADYAYFSSDRISKVRLSDFTRAGELALFPGEGFFTSAVIDSAGGFAYFGTGTYPGVIVKVRLSDFTRVASLQLNLGENAPRSAVIDVAGGYAYFGAGYHSPDYFTPASASPSIIVKVRLSDLTRVANLTLSTGGTSLASAVIDSASGYAYFGTSSGIIVKVRLADFTEVSTLKANQYALDSAVIDPTGGFAYFGSTATVGNSAEGLVVKVRLSDFTTVGNLTLDTSNGFRYAVIDSTGGFAYFITSSTGCCPPGLVVKVRLSDFTEVASLQLDATPTSQAVIDPAADYAYFREKLPYPYGGVVVKVRLSDMKEVGSLPLNPNDGFSESESAVIDLSRGYAYFDTGNYPYTDSGGLPGIVRVQLLPLLTAPRTLQASPDGAWNITLTWNPPNSNGGNTIQGYKVYRGTSPGSETLLATVGNTTTYTDTNVPSPSTTYYYKVAAFTNVEQGPLSNEASASPTPTQSTVTVTFDVSPANHGTITCFSKTYDNGQNDRFGQGSLLTCTANPALGYSFSGWTGLATGSQNPLTLSVGNGGALTANFVPTAPLPVAPPTILLATLVTSAASLLRRRLRTKSH